MEEQSLGMGISLLKAFRALIVCFVVVPVLSWILSKIFNKN
jgi:hypothetical protein